MSRRRVTEAVGGALGMLVVALVLGTAGPASAHVAVSPTTAPAGSSTELTFRVPDEDASAATTSLTVQLPPDHPIPQVLVRPVPGWVSHVTMRKLAQPVTTDDGRFTSAVATVTWRGGRIEPGHYQDFSISVDPLPDQPAQLAFKALQRYSNGEVVRWIDLPEGSGAEPQHPAPILSVVPAGQAGQAGTTPASATGGGSGGTGSVLGWVAVAVAALATGIAGIALRRTFRTR